MEDLELNDFERGYLTAFSHASYKNISSDEHKADEDFWCGLTLGERVFDLNIWHDDLDGSVSCSAYECFRNNDGDFQTDLSSAWHIWRMETA